MEVTVWVDETERVVCGITETTTCQEIIYALAHASGRTGRFVLVEQWRSSERSLAPADHPLELLTKWGEYARDVKFVLKCVEAKSPTTLPAPASTVDHAKTATAAARSPMGAANGGAALGGKPFLVSPHSATIKALNGGAAGGKPAITMTTTTSHGGVSVMSRSAHETSSAEASDIPLLDNSYASSSGGAAAARYQQRPNTLTTRGRTSTPVQHNGEASSHHRPRSIGTPRSGRQRPAQPPSYEQAMLRSKQSPFLGSPITATVDDDGGNSSFDLMTTAPPPVASVPLMSPEELMRLLQKQERILADQAMTIQNLDRDYQHLSDNAPGAIDAAVLQETDEAENHRLRLALELHTLRAQASSDGLRASVQDSLNTRRDVDSLKARISSLGPDISARRSEEQRLEGEITNLKAQLLDDLQNNNKEDQTKTEAIQGQVATTPAEETHVADTRLLSAEVNSSKPPGVWV